MKSRKGLLKYLPAFFTVLAIALMVNGFDACAQEKSGKTIRVAYPVQARLTDITETGKYTGYTYEYLQEIAQYTGWNYEFVQVEGTLDEQIVKLMEMVQSGEVDLITGMMYNEALDGLYNFSSQGYGLVETVLQIPAESQKELAIDASVRQKFRIAAGSKTGRLVNDLNEFSGMNMIETELVQYADEEAMYKAVEAGEADALLNTSMNYIENVRTVAQFAPRQFYFAVAENNHTNLLSRLNEAMDRIYQTDPNFQSTLYEKYFADSKEEFLLSEAEETYIRDMKEVRVGVLTSRPPFQYLDREDGELKGIGVDLLKEVAEKTGLTFTMVKAENQEELYKMASAGEIDMVAGMSYDYETASRQKLSMTRPYASSSYALLLNESISQDNISGKRLALLSTSTYDGYFVGEVTRFDSVEECIQAVNRGDADYTYVDTYTAQYYMNQPDFMGLKMVPQTYGPSRISFGIAASMDSRFLGIMNKAVLTIDAEEMQSIIYTNTLQNQEYSLKNLIERNPLQSMLIVAFIFLFILLLLLGILRQRSMAGKATELELKRHMNLYAVSNDYIFEYDYMKKNFMLSIPESKNPEQKIINYNLGMYADGDESEKSAKSMLEFLETSENGVFERRLYAPGQGWHWYHIVMKKIQDDAGNPVYAIGRLNEVDAEHNEREQLKEQAQRDSLTGLYNNASSQQLIQEHLAAMKAGEKAAMLILDVDYFKLINDTYGHACGDQALRSVAAVLEKNFRSQDIVARPGGDEFVVYISGMKDISALAEKCDTICRGVREITVGGREHLSVSIGAAVAQAGTKYDDLYRAADKTLYQVKVDDRDGYKIAQ